MGTKITKILAWIAMSLTMSSCSCCKVKNAPQLSDSDDKFFEKYNEGDSIKLTSDTLTLNIVVKNINYDKYVASGGGGFSMRQCYGVSKKSFDFKVVLQNRKGILDSLYQTITVSKTNNDGIIQDSRVSGIFHDTITIGQILYQNVFSLENEFSFIPNKYYCIYFNDKKILLATNKDNSIVYK